MSEHDSRWREQAIGETALAMQNGTALQRAAERVLKHSSMYDSEAFRYSVCIDILRELEYALAEEQKRAPRDNWTPR